MWKSRCFPSTRRASRAASVSGGSQCQRRRASAGDRFKYTGRELYATGLQYNRGRYYDAAIGSWTQEDPIGFAAGDANLYRYVGNSSTNATDPNGNDNIAVGNEDYLLSPDGYLMPVKKGQTPPDLRYFDQAQK